MQGRFELLVHSLTNHAILMIDPDGIITEWSDCAHRVLGYTSAAAVGKHFSLLFTDKDRAADEPQRELAEARLTGRTEREGWRRHLDGRPIWLNVVLSAIYDESGRLIGFAKIDQRRHVERHEAADARPFDTHCQQTRRRG